MVLKFIPCTENDNAGEQLTRHFLETSLHDTEGVLLGNYHILVDNGTRECDLILLNQRGVWVIEVKNWRGPIAIDRVHWQRHDGVIQHSPLMSIEKKAKILATMLNGMGFSNISVVGLVVLAHSNTSYSEDVQNKEPRADKIFHLDERLIRAVTGRKLLYSEHNRQLNISLISQIVDMLLPRDIDPDEENIGNYRILHDLGSGPDGIFHAYQAIHKTIPGRFARAKKYCPYRVSSTRDLKEAVERFGRDMHALNTVKDHPNILRVYDYLPDPNSSDIYWLMLEWTKDITLRERLDYGPIPWEEQRHILKAVLEALDCCHSKEILHRNLTPSCIYIANDSVTGDGAVKLGDFDFARVPDLSITLTATGKPLPWQANRYMAPELQTDARTAGVRSDLYSVGAIWYDIVVRPEPDEGIDLSRINETTLPTDARDLLTRLLSPDPDDRPRSAKAVKRWLEQVQDQDTP